MEVTFDPEKRARALLERGLDFADAPLVFAGSVLTLLDVRKDFGEPRFQTFGWLGTRLVMIVWTPNATGRRIISMRKANEREQRRIAGI